MPDEPPLPAVAPEPPPRPAVPPPSEDEPGWLVTFAPQPKKDAVTTAEKTAMATRFIWTPAGLEIRRTVAQLSTLRATGGRRLVSPAPRREREGRPQILDAESLVRGRSCGVRNRLWGWRSFSNSAGRAAAAVRRRDSRHDESSGADEGPPVSSRRSEAYNDFLQSSSPELSPSAIPIATAK